MKRKLTSSRGFTLVELLTSIIILALVTAALSAGISASVRIYRQSTALSEASTLSSTLFEAISDELRFATGITASDGQLSAFVSPSRGAGASFSNGADGRIKLSGQDLIGPPAYTGLDASVEIGYASGRFDVTVTVTDPGQSGALCSRTEFSVLPLNP